MGETIERRTVRLAVIPIHGGDSRFGMNHAYPWPHLLDLCRKAGLSWMRDWSCKWQQVEPEKGRFTFEEADYQIDRPLRHGLNVLAMLPFPSAHWSSSAPADYNLSASYTSRREHVAYAPRDEGEFENYVATTVSHYQDRVRWWQVFNEPVFTTYSLPRKFGYTAGDYARWTKAFSRAARRADPECKVLAGMGYLSDGQILDDWEQFLAAGTLKAVDAGGVNKIFYHAGTCDGINSDSLQGIFFEYAGQPHKIYAAQAVMSHLFTPACKFVKRLALDDGVKGYLFRDGDHAFAVVWAPAGAKPKPIRLTSEKIQVWDLMGRPQDPRRLTPSGTPLYVIGQQLSPEALEAALSF